MTDNKIRLLIEKWKAMMLLETIRETMQTLSGDNVGEKYKFSLSYGDSKEKTI